MLAQVSMAGFTFDQTPSTEFQVGESTVNAGPHVAGKAGWGISSFGGGVASKVDFQFIAQVSNHTNMTVGNKTYVRNQFGGSGHGTQFGTFDFYQVGNQDVYFGEWTSPSAGNHKVAFYVGDNSTTTLPSGTASYSIIGKTVGTGANALALTGTLNANFDNNTVNGMLDIEEFPIFLQHGVINPVTATFGGYAYAPLFNGSQGNTGVMRGSFFGANAAGVAGILDFGYQHILNMGFGGTKN